MNALLAVMAVLGLIAVIIAAYIFAMAARYFVSDDHLEPTGNLHINGLVPRRSIDRRKAPPVTAFPLVINGIVIPVDRRKQPDRRKKSLFRLTRAEE